MIHLTMMIFKKMHKKVHFFNILLVDISIGKIFKVLKENLDVYKMLMGKNNT